MKAFSASSHRSLDLPQAGQVFLQHEYVKHASEDSDGAHPAVSGSVEEVRAEGVRPVVGAADQEVEEQLIEAGVDLLQSESKIA